MSTINHQVIADRLTRNRLRSYLQTTPRPPCDRHRTVRLERSGRCGPSGRPRPSRGDLSQCDRRGVGQLRLISRMAAGLVREKGVVPWWEDLPSRSEHRQGSPTRDQSMDTPRVARKGHRRTGIRVLAVPVRAPHHLTSLWVPALASVFAQHPSRGNPRQIRADVADRMQRLHFLRNRIAHHEPIHQRNLARDHAQLLEVVGWICPDSNTWVAVRSQTPTVIATRP